MVSHNEKNRSHHIVFFSANGFERSDSHIQNGEGIIKEWLASCGIDCHTKRISNI
jgi:hypothetical protein